MSNLSSWFAELSKFVSDRLHSIEATLFPGDVVNFLLNRIDGLSGAAFLSGDHQWKKWRCVAIKGDLSPDELLVDPRQRHESQWAQGQEIYAQLATASGPHLVVISSKSALSPLKRVHADFMEHARLLFSATYQVKDRFFALEERLVALQQGCIVQPLLHRFREQEPALTELAADLREQLALRSVVVARPEDGAFAIEGAVGREVIDWSEFLALTKQGSDPDWLVYTLSNDEESPLAIVGCELTTEPPALLSAQRRTLDAFFLELNRLMGEQRYDLQAMSDPMTGIYNRLYMLRVLNDRIGLIQIDATFALSVAIFDIDGLQQVNDSHGLSAGNEVLKRVADCIVESSRDSDVVGRYGGDEFIVIMNSHINGAVLAVERMRKQITELAWPGAFRVTVSAGVAAFDPHQNADVEDLLGTAAANLEQAKGRGRNGVYPQCVRGPLSPG